MNNKFDFLIFAAIFAALTTLSLGVTAVLVKIVCWRSGLHSDGAMLSESGRQLHCLAEYSRVTAND